MAEPNWEQRARGVLGIRGLQEWGATGTYEEIRRREVMVPKIAAALAQAYGEGLGRGRVEKGAE